jgi:hypothetical protein
VLVKVFLSRHQLFLAHAARTEVWWLFAFIELNLMVLRAMRRKVISRAPREDVCELTILDRESVERVYRAFVFIYEFVEVSLRNG